MQRQIEVIGAAWGLGGADPARPVLLASLSKAITGACVATLIREGRLGFQTTLAAALAKTGRPAEALPYFQRAIDAGARSPAVFNGLGLARLESGDQAGALAAFRMSLTARPDQPEIARLARELSARRRP